MLLRQWSIYLSNLVAIGLRKDWEEQRLLKAGIETARNNSLLFLILGPKLTETKNNLSLQFHIG